MIRRPTRLHAPEFRAPKHHARGRLLVLVALCGCGDAPDPTVTPPESVVHDLARSEAQAQRVEQDLAAFFVSPLASGDLEQAERGLSSGGFAAFLPLVRSTEVAGDLRLDWLERRQDVIDSSSEFLAGLHALAPLSAPPERIEIEVDRFELAPSEDRATGRIRVRWAGDAAEPVGGLSRIDITIYANIEVRTEDDSDWLLTRFAPSEATPDHPLGAGVILRAGAPRYVDQTTAVGLTFGTSARNRDLVQTFVDRHRTLTLGGLTVGDFDRDGRQDVIATRSNEQSILFRNDGVGGFVPEPLPIRNFADQPAFILYVDLDGDGLEEIVASEASRYEGAFAYAGLWTRTGAEEGGWRHLPRAFALPNTPGLRRIALQTVAPLDVDGDGDLDLFFAVYGTGESRGDHYNTVEAHDGADNHLLINQGGLRFTEESEARGITGTGYTYVALAFDVDHDGDMDLFEGNDFGPNVLWRNEGGTFVADTELGFDGSSAYTMGAALADLENDGRWDLYVSNMSSEEGMRMVPHARELSDSMRATVDTIARGNALYSEPGREPVLEPDRGRRWDDRARRLGINEGEWAWGCQFFDVDGDGTLELGVTNGFASHRDAGRGDWQTFYWRQVIDDALRLERGERSHDVNADLRFQGSFNGHERDRLFVRANEGDPDRPWVDAGWCLGLDAAHDGRAFVPFDPDGDGDLDVVLWSLAGLVYYENTGAATDWVRLRLEAAGSTHAALGARVSALSDGVTRCRHVALVEGFQSQVDPDIHLGLGGPRGGATLESLEIEWPGGAIELIADVPTGRRVTLREGHGVVESSELPRWPREFAPSRASSVPWTHRLAQYARTPAAMSLTPAPLVVRVSEGPWPGTSPIEHLLSGVFADVRHVDARPRTGTPEDLEGDMGRTILVDLELVADAVGDAREATIVYDASGQPLRVFRGPTETDAIAAFCVLGRDERTFPHLLIESGRLALEEARYRDALRIFNEALADRTDLSERDAPAFEGLGRAYVLLGRVDLAEVAYRRSTEVDPDYTIGYLNLGAALGELGRFAEAAAALREARRIEGDTHRVLGALAEAAAAADEFDLARESALAWLSVSPDDVAMTILLGKVEARAGELDSAKALFERALELDPPNREARSALEKTQDLLGHTGGD